MAQFEGAPSISLLAIILVLFTFAASLMHRVFYNLYQHPLAHIPGPKLASATYLYQTYFSLAGGKSRYYTKFPDFHKKYGPLVRITPDEVLLCDTDNYDTIFCVGSKYAKSVKYYGALGAGYSTFTAGPAEVHRPRRARLNPFFSLRNVLNLEYLVHSRAEKLASIISEKFSKNEAVDLHHAFRSISVDVISDYAFGESYELLAREDLGREFFENQAGIGPPWWVFQQWPAVQAFALSLPPALAMAMSKPLKQMFTLMERSRVQVLKVKAKLEAGEKVEKPCIFEDLLTPADGYVVPTPDQIKDESYAILNAASDTTGNAMSVAAFNVVSNPDIHRTLTAELEAAFPDQNDKLEYMKLEKLPYLTAVIKEGLRLSFGVPGRLARVVPASGATFNGCHLPPGSIVSMSSWIMHQDEKYFSNPQKFDPTRWLDPKEAQRIDKAFAPFSKGSRSCVGINLAYCEIYVTLGLLFRRFKNLKANDLKDKDLVYDDYFSAQVPLNATKFHVSRAKQ